MKKVLLVVSGEDFRDEEYFETKEVLEDEGFYVETASNVPDTAFGSEGGEARIDAEIKDIDVSGFEGIFLIGGQGALKYLDNDDVYQVFEQADESKIFFGAICISPVILARAGLLKNRRATVWTSPLDKSTIKILEKNGAIFVNQPVVQDDRIITANGPRSAKDFGKKIVEALSQDEDI